MPDIQNVIGSVVAIKDRAKLQVAKFRGFGQEQVPESGGQYEEFELDATKIKNLKNVDGINMDVDDTELPERDPVPLRKIDTILPPNCPCCNISKRMTMSVLASIGFLISFGIRCNMGVAVIQMTSNMTATGLPEIGWTDDVVGVVDSSFFWGYIVTQIPGGLIANRIPAHKVFGTAIVASSCLNLLIPWSLRLHPVAVIIVRILQGLVEGVTYPACHGIWRQWAPPLERSKLATMAFAGSYGGAVLGIPLSAYLTEWIGWPAPFYFYGMFGIIWFFFWYWLSFEKPASHPTITAREQYYIEQCIGKVETAQPTFATTPWRAFFTSMPVWAIIVANIARSWTFYLLIISQPTYFKEVFHYNIAESGTVSALPHLVMTIIVPFGGRLADYIRGNNILSTTNVRKVFNCGGFGMEALFLMCVAFTRDTTTAIVCLTLAVGFSGFAISGLLSQVCYLRIVVFIPYIILTIQSRSGLHGDTTTTIFCLITTRKLECRGSDSQRVVVTVICNTTTLIVCF
ncbi:unnamed protein product, partial [Meganyctiphanes norvegica]